MVKGVATSIITVAVLMGSVVGCGGSDNQLSEKEKNEWIILCSAVVEDYNCAQLAQAMGESITEYGVDKHCIKEELLIFAGFRANTARSEAQYKRMQDLCGQDKEEEIIFSDEINAPAQSEPDVSSESVLHPPAEVRVLVANGTDVAGAAGAISEVLVYDQGYNGLPAVVATIEKAPDFSFVYYADGYLLDARNVALIINADFTNVLPMPAAPPVADLAEANVLVLLGSDLFPSEPVVSSESVLHPPAEVRVLVANGSDVAGAAGAIREVLISRQGYNGLPAVVATTEEVSDFSFVYYANGYELDARNVGLIIGVESAHVLPMPAALPVADLAEANVLVLLGSDLYPD